MRWIYDSQIGQWQATFGSWQAIVDSPGPQCTWRAAIRRHYRPYGACAQADFEWPHAARHWCEAAIMRERWGNRL